MRNPVQIGVIKINYACVQAVVGFDHLPRGFQETVVASGFNGATAMEVSPDGRVFVCEQTGTVRVVRNDVLLPLPLVSIDVDSSWERGLLGVALDPAFPRRPSRAPSVSGQQGSRPVPGRCGSGRRST